jgi:uncharacterized protein DUF6275
MYTSHGHQIPGTTVSYTKPFVHRCGGLAKCEECIEEARVYEESIKGLRGVSFQASAEQIVFNHITTGGAHPTLTMADIYVVWFCKTLQNWKALISTTVVDGRYYEVTYDGDKKQTYLDCYVKAVNIVIPD